MSRHDSDSELSGKVVASLTPPVVHVPMQRGEQSSGFFDLNALYTVRVEQIRMPALSIAPVRRRLPQVAVVERTPRMAERRIALPRPIGWFAVFVAWLATMTISTMVSTQLPGHVRMRPRMAAAPETATGIAPAAAAATSTATTTTSGPPVFSFAELPKAVPSARPRVRRAAPRAAQPASAPEEVAPSPPVAAVVVAPRPAPASNGDTSLEELIRHEVAAEQKRLHGAPAN